MLWSPRYSQGLRFIYVSYEHCFHSWQNIKKYRYYHLPLTSSVIPFSVTTQLVRGVHPPPLTAGGIPFNAFPPGSQQSDDRRRRRSSWGGFGRGLFSTPSRKGVWVYCPREFFYILYYKWCILKHDQLCNNCTQTICFQVCIAKSHCFILILPWMNSQIQPPPQYPATCSTLVQIYLKIAASCYVDSASSDLSDTYPHLYMFHNFVQYAPETGFPVEILFILDADIKCIYHTFKYTAKRLSHVCKSCTLSCYRLPRTACHHVQAIVDIYPEERSV